jgi:hypothetical protein
MAILKKIPNNRTLVFARKYLYVTMRKCIECKKNAFYGNPNETPSYCRNHRKDGMVNIVHPTCEEEGCFSSSRAFGYPGQKGSRCKKHALSGMVNVVNKLCEFSGCKSTSRIFDVPGGKGRYCKDHATSIMVNVVSVKCEDESCESKSRNFDVPGGKGRFCNRHKQNGMINIRNHTCIHPGCQRVSSFSTKGNPPQYCSEHKLPGMCMPYTCCEYEGCKKTSGCNFPNETKGRFCASHKLDGMIYVRKNICKYSGCEKTASFGITIPEYCKQHAEDRMRNLIAKYCEHNGCEIQATYATIGNRPKFCMKHCEEGMICVIGKGCEQPGCQSKSRYYDNPGGKGRFCTKHKQTGMVDVSNPKCEEPNCKSLASYGIPGGKKTACSKHRKHGMLSRPRARCIVCRKPAFYGKSYIPKHCETHKESDDDNLVERECVSCHLIMVLDKNNKCEYCEPIRFQTNRLAKKNALMEYLDHKALRGNSTDIVIENGICGKERPDRVFDFDDKIVIVECDEHQHQERQCECEQTRMVNISQSYGGVPVYFIRWNPDNYVSNDNKLPEPVQRRHLTLAKYLEDIRDEKIHLPRELLNVCYMYYNEWYGIENMKWETILKFEAS